jgi:hypothetical protein
VNADEVRRQPLPESIAHERGQCAPHRQVHQRAVAEQGPQGFAECRLLGRPGAPALGHPAQRLAHGQAEQQGERDAGQAHQEERRAPTVEFGDPAAGEQAEDAADGNAERIDGKGRGAFLRRIIIGDQRMRRR